MNIRTAGVDDINALLDLYQHLNPEDVRAELIDARRVFETFTAIKGSRIFIADCERAVVSSCTLVVIPNLTRGGRPYGLIENVVTHIDYRKQGFGKAVLDYATDAAWDAGCYKVMLMTGSKRPGILEFYRRAGFEQSKIGFQKRQIPARRES